MKAALIVLCAPALAWAAPAPKEVVVPLWSGGAPGSEGKTAPEVVVETDGIRRVSSIHNPSLTVHLPPKKKATGAAVIIMPGGGHRYLSIDNEGHKVAAWLNEHGVAGFVLKYRLAREPGSTYTVAGHALADAQRALRLVRSRAKEWGVDPARVGVMGFSAGGELAIYAASRYDAGKPEAADPIDRESARPAFQALIYPGGMPADLAWPKDAPPAFLCTAADDKGPTKNALELFQKLREGGLDAELHVYAHGGHGFGMKDRPYPITAWAQRLFDWMGDRGFLKAAPPPPPPSRAEQDLDRAFAQTVRPFVDKYCVGCHGDKPKGDLDLRPYRKLSDVVAELGHWGDVEEKLTAAQMPPKKAKVQPTPAERQPIVAWIQAARANEAKKHAGDPGPVAVHRLSNAEYNYTIRDLTGVDIRPAREFPVDPTNPAGFDNSGESLAMSPALLKKYLQAARQVASHLVLETAGIAFAPHPMLVETDRDKYCVQKIVDFYHRQNTDLAAYFRAAWRFKHRAALGTPRATLARLAGDGRPGLSPKYLETIWRTVEGPREAIGPIAHLQKMWRALPVPHRGDVHAADAGIAELRGYVLGLRKKLEPRFEAPSVKGLPGTSQPFAMWRNQQYASHRMSCDHQALQPDGRLLAQAAPAKAKGDDGDADEEAPAAPVRAASADPELAFPSAQRASYEAAFDRFCAVFPDAFYVAERGRTYGDTTHDKGRLLSAGFHNLMGYFRDDQPLSQLLLDGKQQAELDRLWREMDFVAATTARTYVQFYFNGSGSAVRQAAGAPSNEITAAPAIAKLKAVYLGRAGGEAIATKAITDHFDAVNATLRWVESAKAAAEPKHLDAMLALAERAYRRPLTFAERDGLGRYYRQLRGEAHLDHEEAMRDLLVSILMSPDFCFRLEPARAEAVSTAGPRPLSDYALASRLSYFLWSTMPDGELLAHARAGDLHRPEVLAAQARRLLKDPRVRGLATEFGGGWLDFRRFDEHNGVDRQRFPSFDDGLRAAMYEEPIRFLVDLFQHDRSILDVVAGDYTFVNAPLARHYGMPVPKDADGWWRVDDAAKYGRGGVLPMAAFLTKNAPGLRTSPVKRGYWVVKSVLGERIPPPPPVVPELPRDEAKAELPLRELMARHREDPACAACHARFDAMGLALEGFGPIGEQRTKDLAGRAVDARATFPGGGEGDGIAGLRQYVTARRQGDFVQNLARKLLSYAIGRSLITSDEPTVAATTAKLAKNGYRFDTLVESVVTSPQFMTKRGREALAVR